MDQIKYIFVLLIFILFNNVNCRQNNKNVETINPNVIESHFNIPLDQNTTPYILKGISTFEINEVLYVSFYNKLNGNVYIYNFENAKLEYQINILEHYNIRPYEVGIYNKDSIFVREGKERLYLIDDKGFIKHSYNTERDYSQVKVPPFISLVHNQPVVFNDTIYFSGKVTGNFLGEYFKPEERKTITQIFNDSINYYVPCPEEYLKSNWGYAWNVSHTYNARTNDIIMCFDAIPAIFRFNLKTKKTYRYNFNSKFFKGFRPVKTDRSYYSETDFEEHIIAQPIVRKILYDKFKQVYYILVQLPNKNYDGKKIGDGIRGKEWSIIVINKDFKKVNELKIGDTNKFRAHVSFVSPNGLHILEMGINEDVASFKTLNFN